MRSDLVGRAAVLTQLSAVAVQAPGATATLMMVGETGLGKSALLHVAARTAAAHGTRVVAASGKEAGAQEAYGALAQILWPILDQLPTLPGPLAETLSNILGINEIRHPRGPVLVRQAVLALLTAAAEARPILLALDDVDLFDRDSRDVIADVVRRLSATPVAVIVTARRHEHLCGFDLSGPVVELAPLTDAQSAELLALQPRQPHPGVVGEVIRWAGGNPLALIEIARMYARTGATVFCNVGAAPTGAAYGVLAAQLAELPGETRRLLLFAAADTAGDRAEIITATAGYGDDMSWWEPARDIGFVTVDGDGRIDFRYRLARSAAYYECSPEQQREAHLFLADGSGMDSHDRAWHLAAAAIGTDESAAQGLEDVSSASRQRGGYLEVARVLQRAAELSVSPEAAARRYTAAASAANFGGDAAWAIALCDRAVAVDASADAAASRAIVLASVSIQAGQPAEAIEHIAEVMDAPVSPQPQSALELAYLAANAAYYSGDIRHRVAVHRWSDRVPEDVPRPDGPLTFLPNQWADLARDYLRLYADCAGSPHARPRQVDRRWLTGAARAGSATEPYPLLATGVMAYATEETAVAARRLGAAVEQLKVTGGLRGFTYATAPLAWSLLDIGAWDELSVLLDEAAGLAEVQSLTLVRSEVAICKAQLLAYRGDSTAAKHILAEHHPGPIAGDRSATAVAAMRAAAWSAVAAGDFESAYRRLRQAFTADGEPVHFVISHRLIADLAWTAARSGKAELTQPLIAGIGRQLGSTPPTRLRLLRHQALALMSSTQMAERHYRLAVFDPAGDEWPLERARARLHYGEWLRRARRPSEARPLLEAASECFEHLGATPLASLARAELRAAGVSTTDVVPVATAMDELTAQEREVVTLAASGLTNREIADRLGVSPRTIGSHLYHAYPKLGVSRRHELRQFAP